MDYYSASTFGNDHTGFSERKYFKVNKFFEATGVETILVRQKITRIYLLTGESEIYSAGNIIQTGNSALFFEPAGSYVLKTGYDNNPGFVCLFANNLLEGHSCVKAYRKLMAFAKISGLPSFDLDTKQKNFMISVFQQMIVEQDTGYKFAHELFADYLNLVFHEVLKQLVR